MFAKYKTEIIVIILLIAAIIGVVIWTVWKMNVVNGDDLVTSRVFEVEEFKGMLAPDVPFSPTFFESTETVTVFFNGKINAAKLTTITNGTFGSYYVEKENACLTVMTLGAQSQKNYEENMVATGMIVTLGDKEVTIYRYSDVSLVLGTTLSKEGEEFAFIVEVAMNADFTVGDKTMTSVEYLELIGSELYNISEE